MITTILFDFGGVMVDWNPRYVYKSYFQDDEKMEWFLENICTDDWNIEQDRGRSLEEATEILVQKFPEWEKEIRMYYDQWETMLKSDIPETVAIFYQLKAKFKVFGLTNWSAETFPIALKRYKFFQEFEGILVSGEEKLIKPDPKIFHLALQRFGLNPAEVLFIDDNQKNVLAARELGIDTVHFTNPKDLKVELESRNLL